MELSEERLAEYRRIAYYYYRERLPQGEIASLLGTSRQRVNRILQKCEELGIVRIEISDPDRNTEMEISLAKRYGLRAVRIARPIEDADLYRELGKQGAACLQSTVKSGDIVGFSRGRAAYAVSEQFPETGGVSLTVTQLTGNTLQVQSADADRLETDQIVREFARKTGAAINRLSFPVLVQKAELKASITGDPFFRESYDVIRRCGAAVVGIGTAGSYETYLEHAAEDIPAEKKEHGRARAAGEICTHFYDAEGKPVRTELRDRIIAVELEDFLGIPVRIGIAGGTEKREAVAGALNGHLINVLVTDYDTARWLLESDHTNRSSE